MSNGINFNEDYTLAVLPGASAIVSTEVQKLNRPTNTIASGTDTDYIKWGEGDNFPQQVILDVNKDPEIGILLEKKANLLYSGGLIWGIPTKDADGNEYLKPLEDNQNKEVKAFLKATNINRYLSEAALDLEWFSNVFVEIVLNIGRDKIIQIATQAAEECRLGLQNKTTGLIEKCFINANFPTAKISDDTTKKLPVLDAYYSPSEKLKLAKELNFIYVLNYASPGKKFYQLASWNAIRESGWLEISQLIPQFKKGLLENQMTIKYHIQISSMYWEKKFEDWSKISVEEKKKRKESELDSMQKTLSGAEKAGKSITSVIFHDFNNPNGKEFEMIKITPLDDKIADGKYLEDGKDASLYKNLAMGIHPAISGGLPNSGLGGAGSNIREAYNLHIMTNKVKQDILLEPLNNLVIQYNGWNPDMEFRFNNQFMTTLDAKKEIKKA
jgi:hypothetical protein